MPMTAGPRATMSVGGYTAPVPWAHVPAVGHEEGRAHGQVGCRPEQAENTDTFWAHSARFLPPYPLHAHPDMESDASSTFSITHTQVPA